MNKNRFVFPLKLAGLLFLGIGIGFLLMLCAYALPVEPMAENLRLSVPALDGQWHKEDSYEQLIPGYVSTQLDNSTDAAMLLAAVHKSDLPLITRAVENYTYTGWPSMFVTLCGYDEVEDPTTLPDGPIARYWHGYLVVLKPLLMLFSYMDIRMILLMAQGALLSAVIVGFCRNRLNRLIIPFLLSLIGITPGITGFSLQFSTAFITMLLGMLGYLYLPQKRLSTHGQLAWMLLIGIFTSFVDYLTYPIVTFGLPCIVCMARFPQSTVKAEWLRFVQLGLCWLIGYFGMWAGKWVLASLLGNEEWFWANLLDKINLRSSETNGDAILSYGDVLLSVISIYCKKAYLLVGVVASAGYAARLMRSRRCSSPFLPQKNQRWVLLAVSLMPFLWFSFTKNHTYAHAFYTSRSLAVSLFAGCCFLSTFLHCQTEPGTPKE